MGKTWCWRWPRLTGKIPEKAKRIISGFTDPNEALKRLDELYGDKNMAVFAAMRDLMHLKMPEGLPHKKVKALVQVVRLTKT